WPDGFKCSLPVDATTDELSRLEARFTRACDAAEISPLFIRARLVFPAEFNDLIAYYGTKGGALSHVTVGLLREVMDRITVGEFLRSSHPASRRDAATITPSPQPPIYVLCDKH